MGMFDSYYISEDFDCPVCGTTFNSEKNDFQSKEGECWCNSYKLGDKMDSSKRYWDWYAWCEGRYVDKNGKKSWEEGYDKENYPKCKCEGDETIWCRVYINTDGVAYREVVTLQDKVLLDKSLPTEEQGR